MLFKTVFFKTFRYNRNFVKSVFVINVFHCSFTEYKIHDHGVGLGLEVPCFYHFDGRQNFIRKLQESLKE